jgi:small subunit ribosomal protein S16
MVRIRLRRVGARNQPSYRIVVTDRRSPRDGRFIEAIGFYNPRTEPETVTLDEGRALHWLEKGAQPSEAVERLMKNLGTLERFERLRAGEALETLLAEAEAAFAARPEVDPRTRRDDLAPGHRAAEAKAATKVEEPEAEAEGEPEAEAQAENAAEAEVEADAAEAGEPEAVTEAEPEAGAEANAEAEGEPEADADDAAEPEEETEAEVE